MLTKTKNRTIITDYKGNSHDLWFNVEVNTETNTYSIVLQDESNQTYSDVYEFLNKHFEGPRTSKERYCYLENRQLLETTNDDCVAFATAFLRAWQAYLESGKQKSLPHLLYDNIDNNSQHVITLWLLWGNLYPPTREHLLSKWQQIFKKLLKPRLRYILALHFLNRALSSRLIEEIVLDFGLPQRDGYGLSVYDKTNGDYRIVNGLGYYDTEGECIENVINCASKRKVVELKDIYYCRNITVNVVSDRSIDKHIIINKLKKSTKIVESILCEYSEKKQKRFKKLAKKYAKELFFEVYANRINNTFNIIMTYGSNYFTSKHNKVLEYTSFEELVNNIINVFVRFVFANVCGPRRLGKDKPFIAAKLLRCSGSYLCSPHYFTPWKEATLYASNYVDSDKVEYCGGIHAFWLPLMFQPTSYKENNNVALEFVKYVYKSSPWLLHNKRGIYDNTIAIAITTHYGNCRYGAYGIRSEYAALHSVCIVTSDRSERHLSLLHSFVKTYKELYKIAVDLFVIDK